MATEQIGIGQYGGLAERRPQVVEKIRHAWQANRPTDTPTTAVSGTATDNRDERRRYHRVPQVLTSRPTEPAVRVRWIPTTGFGG
ncbi:hypothetical protein Pen02_03190 [Plantactinospora endophytica]|uniref:Uncharacterized protein n=1 Tax=Plantactinospora endophytica TaxID=673535 RepID=A0ABQ4DSF8_9ACTN|nr:hypothetical protein Pen02_03190 [Plantactinospora endophytica]